MAMFSRPVPLQPVHRRFFENFDCGDNTLNLWLKVKALPNEQKGGSRTYLSFSNQTGELAGYFALSSHSVSHESLRAKLRRNMPAPLPVILLGRLAVAKPFQRHGLGESLLREAVLIASGAAASIGIAALVVEPVSEKASAFYRKHGFSIAKTGKELLFLGLHWP